MRPSSRIIEEMLMLYPHLCREKEAMGWYVVACCQGDSLGEKICGGVGSPEQERICQAKDRERFFQGLSGVIMTIRHALDELDERQFRFVSLRFLGEQKYTWRELSYEFNCCRDTIARWQNEIYALLEDDLLYAYQQHKALRKMEVEHSLYQGTKELCAVY